MSEIPQKMTVGEALENPHLWALGAQLEISVDGQIVESVTRYDVPAGEVEHYAKGADGRLKIEGGELVRETLRGTVLVRRK